MMKYLKILLSVILILSGCSNIPSTEELDGDLGLLDKEIKEAAENSEVYSGGLLSLLTKVRLETLRSTKAMLEQKRSGFKRYIPLSYSIEGKKFSPPDNKTELLKELGSDIKNLKLDLAQAEKESEKYSGGLLQAISLTRVSTVKNSVAFLEQRQLLLKHDIPYYSILPAKTKSNEPTFKPTPGKDINKF